MFAKTLLRQPCLIYPHKHGAWGGEPDVSISHGTYKYDMNKYITHYHSVVNMFILKKCYIKTGCTKDHRVSIELKYPYKESYTVNSCLTKVVIRRELVCLQLGITVDI